MNLFNYFRFPFYNEEINNKWIEFVQKSSKRNETPKSITKYSSICSLHFKSSDFNPHGKTTRKFLKRSAVPSKSSKNIQLQEVETEEPDEITIIDDEPLIYESCGLCRTQTIMHQLNSFDEYNFTLMRKCIPFINFNVSCMQKICVDCEAILNTFSSFIDKILIAQNLISQEIIQQQNESRQFMNIKVEPPPEDEEVMINFERPPAKAQRPPTQKKLEILEIVDIKPMNFLPYETNALNCELNETYEECPPQLKVEIADEGDNELEEIKKYMFVSSVCMHDHNYFMEGQELNMRNIKTEYEVEEISEEQPDFFESRIVKICCRKKFKSFRKFLLHKMVKHKKTKECKACKKLFPNEISLNHHKKYFCNHSTSGNKSYKKILQRLKKKKLKRKPKVKKSYSCPTCKKLFKGPKNLYQHKLSHRIADIACNICGQVFKRKHGLRQHIAAQHEKKRIYNCPICNHPYALKGDIKRCKHSDLKKNNVKRNNSWVKVMN